MKLRSFVSALLAVVLALLLVSAVGLYWLVSHSPLTLLQGGATPNPAAALFVPKQAPAMASLLINPDRLESFRLAVASPGSRRRARAELDQLKQILLANTGLDYSSDIRPWLGDEVTVAVTTLDVDRNPDNGQQPGYLLAIATQDAERSRQFLQLFWQKRAVAGADLVFEQYAGVKLIYGGNASSLTQSAQGKGMAELAAKTLSSPSLASAVVGDQFVMFANSPKVLRDAINNVQAPDLNLNSSRAYQQTLQSLSVKRIGLTYVNLPQLTAWLGQDGAGASTAANVSEEATAYESLVAALSLDRGGLLADTALLAKAGEMFKTTRPDLISPVDALQFIPAGSPAAASGRNLQRRWDTVSSALAHQPTLALLTSQPIARLQERWQIDLPQDIFSWVTGDYALGMVPRPDRDRPDWVFVARQAADTTTAIAHLDDLAQAQGLSVGPLTLANQRVYAWTRLSTAVSNSRRQSADTVNLQAEVLGVHAAVDDYELFATSVEAMNQALQAPGQSLLVNSEFQRAIAPLATANDGYLYVEWPTVQALIEQRLPVLRLAKLAGQPLLDHVRALTISGYGSEAQLQRGAVFIELQD